MGVGKEDQGIVSICLCYYPIPLGLLVHASDLCLLNSRFTYAMETCPIASTPVNWHNCSLVSVILAEGIWVGLGCPTLCNSWLVLHSPLGPDICMYLPVAGAPFCKEKFHFPVVTMHTGIILRPNFIHTYGSKPHKSVCMHRTRSIIPNN